MFILIFFQNFDIDNYIEECQYSVTILLYENVNSRSDISFQLKFIIIANEIYLYFRISISGNINEIQIDNYIEECQYPVIAWFKRKDKEVALDFIFEVCN